MTARSAPLQVSAATQMRPAAPPAALYRGTVRHRRDFPVARVFTPALWLAYLDVDALPGALDELPLWSARRPAPIHFRRRDFFDGGTEPLGTAVRDLVEDRLDRRPTGRIFLLAQLRTVGFLFNPLVVYYCWTPDGRALDAVVLEVTNTPWGERTWYVFDARAGATSGHAQKTMHVSPFLEMDVEYRVTWTTPSSGPSSELTLGIDVARAGRSFFRADLALVRVPLDRRSASALVLRHPLLPLRGFLSIYREAVRLLVARVPLHRHPRASAVKEES